MPAPRKILCPIDFSEGSLAALDEALLLGEAFDAKVDLLHVWELPTAIYYEGVIAHPSIWKRIDREAEAAARAQMKRLVERFPEAHRARITEHVALGDPVTEILDHAAKQRCDLIAMGTHGRRGAARFLVGSVAERVVRHSACPVLTVRRRDARKRRDPQRKRRKS